LRIVPGGKCCSEPLSQGADVFIRQLPRRPAFRPAVVGGWATPGPVKLSRRPGAGPPTRLAARGPPDAPRAPRRGAGPRRQRTPLLAPPSLVGRRHSSEAPGATVWGRWPAHVTAPPGALPTLELLPERRGDAPPASTATSGPSGTPGPPGTSAGESAAAVGWSRTRPARRRLPGRHPLAAGDAASQVF
jgi:hypothetical protein